MLLLQILCRIDCPNGQLWKERSRNSPGARENNKPEPRTTTESRTTEPRSSEEDYPRGALQDETPQAAVPALSLLICSIHLQLPPHTLLHHLHYRRRRNSLRKIDEEIEHYEHLGRRIEETELMKKYRKRNIKNLKR